MAARLRAVAPYAVVLAVAAVLFHVASVFIYARLGDRLGPDVWPRAILLLMIVTCAVRIVRVLWVGPDGATRDAAGPDAAAVPDAAEPIPGAVDEAPPRLSPARLMLGVAATVLYVLLLPVLGFALGTALFIAAMCRIGNYRRWGVIVPTAIIGSLAFMFVFQRIVYVSLPIGTPPFDVVALTLMQLMGIR
jgi:putative tricarboxylic transport membrane protein